MNTLRKQRGISMLGWLVIIAIGGLLLTASIKLIPVYLEYYNVVQIMQNMQEEPSLKGATHVKILDSFRKRLNISHVTNLKKENYSLKKADRGGGYVLHIDYEVRRPLVGNLDIVAHFKRSAEVGG